MSHGLLPDAGAPDGQLVRTPAPLIVVVPHRVVHLNLDFNGLGDHVRNGASHALCVLEEPGLSAVYRVSPAKVYREKNVHEEEDER